MEIPAWQWSGDAHVLVENLRRFLRLTDLDDQTSTFELHALLRHGLLKVVSLHDAKVIGLDGQPARQPRLHSRFCQWIIRPAQVLFHG